jgi:hypothetical protein
MVMRRELEKYYSEVDDCLEKTEHISILDSYADIHSERKERLKNPNYHLLVAGNRHQHNQLSLNFL